MSNIKKPTILKNLLTTMPSQDFLPMQKQEKMLSFFSKNRLLFINYPQFYKLIGDMKF